MSKKIVLRKVRLSFPTFGEPEQFQGQGKFRWGGSFLVPNTDPQKKAVDELLEAVALEKWGAKAKLHLNNILPDAKACCWVDGARKDYDGYADCFAITAYRYQDAGRPLIIDADKTPIYQTNNMPYQGKEGRIYAGCYVNVELEVWAQENKQGKGLRATLLTVQYAGKGDAFGGGARPTDDAFDAIDEGVDADDSLG